MLMKVFVLGECALAVGILIYGLFFQPPRIRDYTVYPRYPNRPQDHRFKSWAEASAYLQRHPDTRNYSIDAYAVTDQPPEVPVGPTLDYVLRHGATSEGM